MLSKRSYHWKSILGIFLSSYRKNPFHKCDIITNFAAELVSKGTILSIIGVKNNWKSSTSLALWVFFTNFAEEFAHKGVFYNIEG